MIVGLDLADQDLVRAEAAIVHAAVVARDAKHSGFDGGRSLEREVDWIGSEVAVARALAETWIPRGARPWKGGDIVTRRGEILEVRHAARHGTLIVRHYDEPGRYLFLVTGTFPIYDVAGWLPVEVARARARPHNGWNGTVVEAARLWPVEGWIAGRAV